MRDNDIIVHGARVHNLKNISVEIPKNKMVVFTGVSGSGKSSLVFDTIYTEAQRQLIETFSSFARSRMPKLSKPDMDDIKNISTAIIIDQKRMGTSLRSTVGTATEIYTYMRLLFSRCGDKQIGPSFVFGFNHPLGMCPSCNGLGKRIQIDVNNLIDKTKSIRDGAITHPDYKIDGWNYRELIGIKLFDVDKKIDNFSEEELNEFLYAEAIPVEKIHGEGTYTKNYEGIVRKLERLHINKAKEQLSKARKDAYEKYFNYSDCNECGGTRINEKARSVKVNGKTIPELVNMELTDLYKFLNTITDEISKPIISKMCSMLDNLIKIGVGYLSLNRTVGSLSGGESQRVKMARQLDCDLVDIMYILDEPTIGLHPRDTFDIIEILKKLRDKGNSLLIVEHDKDVIENAEYIIDIGPEAGLAGGKIIYSGEFEGLKEVNSITASIFKKSPTTKYTRKQWKTAYTIHNATHNNLKDITTKIPKGIFTCITGVAGSGKSSLIIDTFLTNHPEAIVINQSPVSTSSRSNPLTYIDVFTDIRKLFAEETRSNAGLFSFNSKGACPKCKGLGLIKVEMHFLDEINIVCDECEGKRYQSEVLELKYKEKNIYEVLKMTVKEGLKFFSTNKILKKLQVLSNVGLDYLEMGQPLSTLSGGEAQRIKLASELHKESNIYIMDEPTTGLHIADIKRLIKIIKNLSTKNNTVIVIEHNLDVIKEADWIIDLGPEGGVRGGEILFEGIPEELIKCKESYTAKYLQKYLSS